MSERRYLITRPGPFYDLRVGNILLADEIRTMVQQIVTAYKGYTKASPLKGNPFKVAPVPTELGPKKYIAFHRYKCGESVYVYRFKREQADGRLYYAKKRNVHGEWHTLKNICCLNIMHSAKSGRLYPGEDRFLVRFEQENAIAVAAKKMQTFDVRPNELIPEDYYCTV